MARQALLAEKVHRAMAYDRKTFKDRVLEKLGAALMHFYKVRLAELNRQTKWVDHWRAEVERLIYDEFETVLVHPIKGKWDRMRAVAEIVAELRAADSGYRTVAENAVKRNSRLRKANNRLSNAVENEFYNMVQEAANETLRIDER